MRWVGVRACVWMGIFGGHDNIVIVWHCFCVDSCGAQLSIIQVNSFG
jgi:hypothetical protein